MFSLLLVLACERSSPPDPVATEAPPVAQPVGPSLYALPMRLETQDGRAVGLDAWRGQPVLISMFYANCRSACPMLMSTIQGFEEELGPEANSELRVLLVSFDPERDSVQALASTAAMHNIDTSRWTLARTDDVRALAAALGIRYSPTQDGEFSHTSPIVLLDGDGNVVVRLDQLADDPQKLITSARQLASN